MSKQLPTIIAAQRSTEWHEQRKGRVTGSVAGAILGLNPFMSPEQALRRMVRDYHNVESLSLLATSPQSMALLTNLLHS